MSDVAEPRAVISGEGTFTPPRDLSLEDCELLARAADETRKES